MSRKIEIKATSFGSESEHWYNADGLVKSVPLASGKGETTRITVAHARKYGLVPSVTSILKIIDKPALTTWKINEHIRACGVVGAQGKDEDFRAYCARVSEQMNRYNDHAAVGTDIHAEIGKWVATRLIDGIDIQPSPIANKACAWLLSEYEALCGRYGKGNVKVESEKPFSSALGFGGTIDLRFICPDKTVYIDFKSTDDDKLGQGALLTYWDSHLAQLVAYDMGMNLTPNGDNEHINIFIGRLGGGIYVHEWTDWEQKKRAQEMFKAALALFKILKGL